MMKTSPRLLVAAIGSLCCAMLLAACGSLIPTAYREVGSASDRTIADSEILLVGRIEIIPPISAKEQKIRVGSFDPADMEGKLRQRALIYMASSEPRKRETSGHYINPRLGEWFTFAVPRSDRFVSEASVFMEYAPLMTGRRTATIDTVELRLPAPIALDIRDADRAVYIGTWRIWRDEFNQVTKVQFVNEHAAAASAVQKAGLGALPTRAALPALQR